MPTRKPIRPENDGEGDADRQTASLAGLVIALLVILVGVLLVHVLRRESALEDCLLAGRLACGAVPLR